LTGLIAAEPWKAATACVRPAPREFAAVFLMVLFFFFRPLPQLYFFITHRATGSRVVTDMLSQNAMISSTDAPLK